jgi:hypothetical protein
MSGYFTAEQRVGYGRWEEIGVYSTRADAYAAIDNRERPVGRIIDSDGSIVCLDVRASLGEESGETFEITVPRKKGGGL